MTAQRLRMTAGLAASAFLVTLIPALAGNVTYHNDNLRTGWYPQEGFITPAIVGGGSFGQRWTRALDGQIYAEPLYANGQVLVVTETNWVYSLDADTGTTLWSKQLGVAWNSSEIGCSNITPVVGVSATPVIDDDTNTIYLVNKQYVTGSSGPVAIYMHALDLVTGAERTGWPVQLQGNAQNAPTLAFDAFHHHTRNGLLFMDGVVYAGFGSHCDIGPWQGWIFGVTTAGQIKAIWTPKTTSSSSGAAIWHSGGGMVSDGPGRIFFTTGNGGGPTGSVPIAGTSPPSNCGECTERVAVQANGTLAAKDFFAPKNASTLDLFDRDLGSGAPMALPSAYFGTASVPNLLVQSGKEGYVYLQNRDSLGGYRTAAGGNDTYVQRLPATGTFAGGVWGKPSVWPGDGGYVYLSFSGSLMRAFKYGVTAGQPNLTNSANSNETFAYGSGVPVVTSDGTTAGSALVWAVRNNGAGGSDLRAYDAVPSGAALTTRFTTPVSRNANYFTPGVGRGQIYVGALDGTFAAYGAPPAQLTVTKGLTDVNLTWSSNAAPYTLRRADDVKFRTNKTTLVDHQPATSFADPVLADGNTYYYLVN